MINVFRSVIDSYLRNLAKLLTANTVLELREWFAASARTTAGFGFNGDVIRTRIIADLFKAAGCTVFIETGTYRAATTILAKRLLSCPVFSCELVWKSWLFAKIRCIPYGELSIVRADSRSFLRRMGTSLGPTETPFIYLDAHWYNDLPLQEELDYVASTWKQCVVLVDDFKVPGRPGFKFDRYGADELCIERFAIDPTKSIGCVSIYFPDYDPKLETGARCGYVIFVCGLNDQLSTTLGRFPLNLLRSMNE